MVRAREWIRERYPHAGDDVQPASLDLRISNEAVVYDWPLWYRPLFHLFRLLDMPKRATRFQKRMRRVKLGSCFWLRPGQMALLSSEYPVRIPKDAVAMLTLKSSRGREGLDHALAGFFDNGFEGDAVFEVYAHAHPVRLFAGMPVAQLIFMESETPERSYDGHYQGQTGPTISWVEETI